MTSTIKLTPMKFGPLLDWRSLSLCISYYFLKWAGTTFLMIDFKIVLEILGALTGITTITFNVFKSINEIGKAWSSFKWRRKRKADNKRQLKVPPAEMDENTEFD